MAQCPAQTSRQQGGQAEDTCKHVGGAIWGRAGAGGPGAASRSPLGKGEGALGWGTAGGDRNPVARECAAGRLWVPAVERCGGGSAPWAVIS